MFMNLGMVVDLEPVSLSLKGVATMARKKIMYGQNSIHQG